MTLQKGKSHKIHQAIRNLEEALADWDGLDILESQKERADDLSHAIDPFHRIQPQRETQRLLNDLKLQLKQFDSYSGTPIEMELDPSISTQVIIESSDIDSTNN